MPTRDPWLLLLGRNVRACRVALGLSQEELAGRCGLDRTYVGGVERGERNVSILNLRLIADGLQIDLPDLVRCKSLIAADESKRLLLLKAKRQSKKKRH